MAPRASGASPVTVESVRAAWAVREGAPPHSLVRFMEWYHAHVDSLELPPGERASARDDGVRLWLEVCFNAIRSPPAVRLQLPPLARQ